MTYLYSSMPAGEFVTGKVPTQTLVVARPYWLVRTMLRSLVNACELPDHPFNRPRTTT